MNRPVCATRAQGNHEGALKVLMTALGSIESSPFYCILMTTIAIAIAATYK
jgi:hypothetical protein